MRQKLWTGFILLFGLLLLGCQPATTTYYKGAKAFGMESVSLVTPIDQQRWQDLYVTVDYSLSRSGDSLDIEGALSFSNNPKVMFTQVRDLKLKLFLLDKEMLVVGYRDIARTLSTDLEDETKFKKTLKLTDDVVAFTFGYEGSFVDNDPENSSSDIVWKLPKRKF
ncbi:MAG: hypothetical protein OQK97_03510 [Deltaproteobacteria bacterium]|jgi:hypothetical protein|nr:hypothetical protein [Deltaproteobacteria bacterium]